MGATEPITLTWSGLAADMRYLGIVNYSDGFDSLGSTLVSITT